MTKKILMYIKKHKDSDNPIIFLLKFFYSISKEWLLGIINIVAGIFLPNVYFNNEIHISVKIILTVLLILINYYYEVVRTYKINEYKHRKLSESILDSCTVITRTISSKLSRGEGSDVFNFASQAVCSELYERLKEFYKCEFRISVMQQFLKEQSQKYNCCKMIARKSKTRLENTNDKKYILKKRSDSYYYVDIFLENEETILILNKDEIKKVFKNRKKKHADIKQYIAISSMAFSDKVAFILQVDCMDDGKLGKNIDEIEMFCQEYLIPYVSILINAYQEERCIRNGRTY